MLISSIRFKIAILYMAILAATLTFFSMALYHNVQVGLHNDMDTLLSTRAVGIEQAINTYWEVSRLEAVEAGMPTTELLRKRRNANFARVAQKWVREESTEPKLLDIIVQVFDTDGAIIASSKNTQGLAGISRKDFITVLQGRERFDTIRQPGQPSGIEFRIYTTPVFENAKVAYIVQVSSPLTSIQIALNNLKLWLFLLFPATVLLTGIMGVFIAKATLRPVDKMTDTIHRITAGNMKLRLDVPKTRDEIQKLAETFNQMLQRLEGAFTSQRRLFEDLSHELKTPLTILKGEFEIALKKARESADYESTLNSALEEINTIIKIAENLLAMAKFDSREIIFEKKLLDIRLLLQGIVNNVKGIASMNSLSISVEPAGGVFVEGDEGQLKTLFLNIVDNAVKYTPRGGQIRIRTDRDGGLVRVVIEDTGIGIPKDELAHIFDRFYRVDKSRAMPGFGLGLSIARAIVDSHAGSITASSEPDKGSVFTITLPAVWRPDIKKF